MGGRHLTAKEKEEIKFMAKGLNTPYEEIASKYNVCKATVSLVVNDKSGGGRNKEKIVYVNKTPDKEFEEADFSKLPSTVMFNYKMFGGI